MVRGAPRLPLELGLGAPIFQEGMPDTHLTPAYLELVRRITDGYFEIDLKGNFTFVNEAHCRIVGRSVDEIVGQNYRQFAVDERHAGRAREAYSNLYKTGVPLKDFAYAFTHTDGRMRYVEDSVELRRNEAGEAVGFIGLRRDTTERKEAAERLWENEARYRAIVEQIEDGYFEMSPAGRYEFVNKAFCEMTGYAVGEIVGQSYRQFFDAETVRQVYEAYHHVFETGEPLKAFEYALTTKDGTHRYVEESVSLRLDPEGKPLGFMGIRRDCTARKHTEQELAAAKEAAEGANKAKSEFLANMSHEIRTPMNGVIGMTDLVLDTELTRYQADCLMTVKASAGTLLEILNDILDFSKIESRRLELEHVPFMLTDLVNDTLKPLALQAHQKGLELVADIALDVPSGLVGDPVRVRQVLTNLIGNAVKFTARGQVVLAVRDGGELDGRRVLRFAVTDSGIGIPAEKHATIFEAFSQADGSTTRRFGGTGLGLTISSTLVKMMGGGISVSSTPGAGSTFEFTAVFDTTDVVSGSPTVSALGDILALIVDDNAVNRRILESQLLRWRMKPTVVDGGQAALEALTEAARNGHPYQLVLLDANMPDLDGFDVAAEIGRRPELSGGTIMMLSSSGKYGDSARCTSLGIAAYLTKPVSQSDLLDSISRILDGRSKTAPSAPAVAIRKSGAERQRRILLAEDNVVNQRVAQGLLSKRGHTVTVVNNGREAVDALQAGDFDLVLMDVQMPEMGGFEATAAIRALERNSGAHMRIVAMTAHAMNGDRERCFAAGMDGYLSKPIDVALMFEVVEQGAALAPAAPSALDRNSALARMGGDEQLLHDVAALFLEDCPARLQAIRTAIDQQSAAGLRNEAHALKGAAGNLSASGLFEAARTLERLGADNQLAGAEAAWRRLSDEASGVMNALRTFENKEGQAC